MTFEQKLITIVICVLGTLATRFLPFVCFSENKTTPKFVQYLGKALPCAVFGMLVVYCFKDVNFLAGNHGLPEVLGVLGTAALWYWRRQMLLSMGGGTLFYMILVQFVFKS